MTNGWPKVPLGEVLTRSSEWIAIHAHESYREVTVRLWGKGVTLRRECTGSEIKSDRRLRVRPNQFIASRIDARNGAFGLIPCELDGAVVTNDFPVFTPHEHRLLPQYLGWMSRTRSFIEMCIAASEGTTNRVRLKEDRFLAIAVPLPPLAEQQRIVARIDSLAAKIAEAHAIRKVLLTQSETLLAAAAGERFSSLDGLAEQRSFSELGVEVTSGPRSWSQYISSSGLRFYRAQDIGAHFHVDNSSRCFITPPINGQGAAARLRAGDLLIVITGATVGRCAKYEGSMEPGFVSQHVAVCRFAESTIMPDYALWVLRSPAGQSQLLSQRYGQGKPGLNLSNLRAIRVPLPNLAEQRRIVAYLDALTAKTAALKQLQSQSAAELDALLPSILDRAFKGELFG